MKVWQLNSPNNLIKSTQPELNRQEGQVKVKITKASLSEADVAIYKGSLPVKYPIIPGRFAIGTIIEADEDSFVKKCDRVYLANVMEDDCSPDGLQTAGETVNGYYTDFTLARNDEVYELPATVSDEAAFLIDAVAMAEHIVDELHITTGQHVLVLGGGIYGNILCQILIYHRAVPILADNNQAKLERAKKCGIYYTYPDNEKLKSNILQVTGGKLADAAVYLAFSNHREPSAIFSAVSHGAYVAYCSMINKSLNVNLENALKNNLTIKGITESREFIPTAINILANKVINFSEFNYAVYPEEKLPEIMKQYADMNNNNSSTETINLFKFMF